MGEQGVTEDTADGSPDRRNASSSLRRALSIMMFLAVERGHPHGLTLTELATGLRLSKSTLLRLLAPLRETRLVEQDPETGRYQLGPQNAVLGQVFLERLDIRRLAAPLLHRLADDVGETVHMVTFEPPEVVYIDKRESPQPVRMASRIGSRQPAHCTATGKVFLAYASDEVVTRVIAAGMPPRTQNTITTPEGLRAELDRIREHGYAIDDVENEPDIRCVGAPVFDHTGTVCTAVSVSGLASRVTLDRVPEIGGRLIAATSTLTDRLGGAPPNGP